MMIVGVISSSEEALEITFMAKCFVVGRRSRYLGRQSLKPKNRKNKKVKK